MLVLVVLFFLPFVQFQLCNVDHISSSLGTGGGWVGKVCGEGGGGLRRCGWVGKRCVERVG